MDKDNLAQSIELGKKDDGTRKAESAPAQAPKEALRTIREIYDAVRPYVVTRSRDEVVDDEEKSDWEKCGDSWHETTYWWGLALCFFGVCVVMTGIINRDNNPPWEHDAGHALLEVVLFWSMLSWIAMLEGCQISVVGLQGYDPESFKESHPRAYAACVLVHKGPNVERFLVGRQFLLLFNGFLVSRIGGGRGDIDTFKMGDWTWSHEFMQFFYQNGVLLMVVMRACDKHSTELNRQLGDDYRNWSTNLVVFKSLITRDHSTFLLSCSCAALLESAWFSQLLANKDIQEEQQHSKATASSTRDAGLAVALRCA